MGERGRCAPGQIRVDGADGARRYAMGDLVRLREDGVFVVVGRTDRQIELDGYRVEPVEIEAILRRRAGCRRCRGAAHGRRRCTPGGFVAAGSSPPPLLAAHLRGRLAARLPLAMRPRRLHVLEALPLLPGNKIDVEALRLINAQRRRR